VLQVYLGQARSEKLIPRLKAFGFGECTQRGELIRPRSGFVGPDIYPWFFDNGAFLDFKAGRAFDESTYLRDLAAIPQAAAPPTFMVVPDIVMGGMESLAFSLSWLPKLRGVAPLYLAVQNGQTTADVARVLPLFDGIFVGGDVPWKVQTGATWVQMAHTAGKPCHIGRVGVPSRVRWALRIEADSIDSCGPLCSEANLQRFLKALGVQDQGDFFD
jgi:hypothetical protein